MWRKIKKWFGSDRSSTAQQKPQTLQSAPEVHWLPDSENKWGVPVLDVRPITLGMLSTSRDPQCATNAISFLADDGLGFVGQRPSVARSTSVDLGFPIDAGGLFDGALFIPRVMEEKWALYFHAGKLLCIRSWTRTVVAVCEVAVAGSEVRVASIEGVFVSESESPEYSARALEYLIRSHCNDEVFPVPLSEVPQDLKSTGLWCFSAFGRRALLASALSPIHKAATKQLRSDSLFHIAVARGDTTVAEQQLKAGVPVDLIARDGLPALHWALASSNAEMMPWLLSHGCSVDVRSVEGATALMTAVQTPRPGQVEQLLGYKPNVNARDARGFTALHRAAERGNKEVVKLLLAAGADPSISAEGHTARSLAEMKPHTEVVALFK